MTVPKGPTAWTILRLRSEASFLRVRKRQVEDYGYLPHELASLSDAAAAADRMAAAVQAGDVRSLRANRAEFDKFLSYAGSAAPYGWKPGKTPVDEVVGAWEEDREAGETDRDEDDPARQRSETHRVRAYTKAEGERVRAHLARNPQRRRRGTV